MTTEAPSAPPVLSTPAEHTFDDDPTSQAALEASRAKPARTDDELFALYEIARTTTEIHERGWRCVALQFPDAMLSDAPWVVKALEEELSRLPPRISSNVAAEKNAEGSAAKTSISLEVDFTTTARSETSSDSATRFYVLADTSYSACCVDEIAAEHANADAVVHYGRACLSPTARLPVLYIFTKQELDHDAVLAAFEKEIPGRSDKVVVMADVMFQDHVEPICGRLRDSGYAAIFASEIVRDPMGTIPNRRIAQSEGSPNEADEVKQELKDHHLFHIASPPTSLLLTLSSRLASLHIYPTPASPYSATSEVPDPSATPGMLNRRYGLVIRLATASIIGILVNTLSVQNYQSTIAKLKEEIAAAGKKSYTIVVGKLNAAKLANFSEIDGWVVVGCWESGLVDQSGFWKPVGTPFELDLALAGDEARVWDGSWWGGIEGVDLGKPKTGNESKEMTQGEQDDLGAAGVEGGVDDEESAPPEFDLRTGKLISNSRPMRVAIRGAPAEAVEAESGETATGTEPSSALIQRNAGELAVVNGVVSPGAEYLRSHRTWQGLGSDCRDEDGNDNESVAVEQGRSGIARGYTVGEDGGRS